MLSVLPTINKISKQKSHSASYLILPATGLNSCSGDTSSHWAFSTLLSLKSPHNHQGLVLYLDPPTIHPKSQR